MPRSSRDAEFSDFVEAHRAEFLRAACLLTAGDPHTAEDLVQTALARAYVAWPRLRERPVAYVHRVVVNTYIDETRRPWWRRERSVPDLPEPGGTARHAKDKDKDPLSFLHKLTVLSASPGEKHDGGTPQPVAGRPGYVSVQGDTQILRYETTGGHWVDVQAPTSLGWDGARIARFAAGVTILKTAQPGVG